MSCFERLRVMPRVAVSHAYAMSSAATPVVNDAEKKVAAGKIHEAIEMYRKLTASIEKGDKSAFYLRSRSKLLEWQEQFETGEWVNIMPDPEMIGWGEIGGEWRREGDSVIGTANDRGLMLACQALFTKGNFQVEAVIDMPPEPQHCAIGLSLAPGDPFTYWGLWMKRERGADENTRAATVFVNEWRRDDRDDLDIKSSNKLRLSAWENSLDFDINGQCMIHMNEMENTFQVPKLYIGVGGRQNPPGVQLRLKSIRLRKLDEAPEH
jgi:hypothetical protein